MHKLIETDKIGDSSLKTFQKPLSAAEERMYLERLKMGEQEAKDILIERNMRLVAHMIKKYAFIDKDMDDLLSIGYNRSYKSSKYI